VLADYARRNADRLTWLEIGDELLAEMRVINGRDVDLAEDANRAANCCRDALTAVSPALERVLGARLGDAGVRDLVRALPTPTVLAAAGKAKITKRSPRIATKVEELFLRHPLGKVLVTPTNAQTRKILPKQLDNKTGTPPGANLSCWRTPDVHGRDENGAAADTFPRIVPPPDLRDCALQPPHFSISSTIG
jgi:hypothetical protein